MISLQALQSSFNPSKHALFHLKGFANKNPIIVSPCRSTDSGSEDISPEGDTRKQEILARMAMLQTSKVRLTDYLDERSAYLTQFAEEANAEIDQIGEAALKGLDEASSRIMENIESRMQAFEESSEMSKLEIEKSEKELSEFEGQLVNNRNEGLFFKNLGDRKPTEKANAKEVVQKIKQLTMDSAGSKTRRNIYFAMMGLLVFGIADSLISKSSGWQKPTILGVILIGVISQLIYEQSVLSETERMQKGKNKRDKE